MLHSILQTGRSAADLIPAIENATQFCQDLWEVANHAGSS